MTAPIPERSTVVNDRDLVVFLIGMRINQFHRVHEWLPAAMAMPRMLRELRERPASGLLHFEAWFGNPTIMVQYWESTEQLLAYAHDRKGEHFPAWADFNRKAGRSGAMGVWHETYSVPAGRYECIYHHMPVFGLGRALPLVPAKGRLSKAKDRLVAATPAASNA